ncbi:hypothetical protein SAMN05421841_1553 [Chryseobacterium wanjuense]|jgi:hypothetical protein|uniref:Uncharacterized protein n=1 Tax=Chryseobacterium wanjuense TaxID=356305 RepID=A0A1I0PZS0_9FLAO|nr:hypothetical protein [Chryseobacterium wanjuense]SEW20087.1 hypothetical protein SAMN05421841_1553 [Chryseobacterium wanjuense]
MKVKILGFLLISQFYLSQNIIQADIQGKKLDYFVQLENKLGSKIYKTDEEHISSGEVLQPVIFERKEKDIPNLLVFYTPNKKDSTISEILYEWDVYNFDKGDNVKKTLSFNKAMIKKYYQLVDEVSKKYGKSIQKGNLEKLELLNAEDGLERSDNWEINKNLKINSYIILSEYYEKNGMVTTTPTHKIRLYVTNGDENEKDILSEEKIKLFNDEFLKFIDKLKTSDFNEVRNFLSEKIRSSTTDEVLKNLIKNTHFEKKVEIFMTGYQIINDGNQYPMLQYKYVEDDFPPNEIITVLFEENGKILGIKPVKKIE